MDIVIKESATAGGGKKRSIRVVVGDAREPLRPIHGLVFVGGMLGNGLADAAGGGFALQAMAGLMGFAVARSALVAAQQARAALGEDAARREGSGEARIGALTKVATGVAAFSRLARAQAMGWPRGAALLLGPFAVGAAIKAAGWAPKAGGFKERADGWALKVEDKYDDLKAEAETRLFEQETLRGAKHCERMLFARLNELEAGKAAHPSFEMEELWRRSGMSGAQRESGAEELGSIAKRLSRILADPHAKLAQQWNYDEEALSELLRLCEVSAEAVEIKSVVGEAAAVGGRRPARLRV